ncbi:MAG: xylose isomerase [Draconibacterium sp.]|nr:MAG: xylose isomerase [Draconibacterium sp.]
MKVNKKRREFIRISTAGALGLVALGPMACKPGAKKNNPKEKSGAVDRKSFGVGIQLYTIRDAMAADVEGSLKKVSDLGYKYIELASYSDGKFYGYAPADFKKMVEDLGLKAVSSHAAVESKGITRENAQKMADDHAALGVEYCIQPWVNEQDRTIETYKKMIADWNEVGAIMKDAGVQFGYHNHNFEFKPTDGIVPYYDIFMPEMDPELIVMELDLYWATKAGQNPVEMFEKYPGRFHLLHFKDMLENNGPYYDVIKDDITSVGSGQIDFKSIYNAREIGGVKYYFVEDDNQGNGKPFKGIETSIKNITTKIAN